MQLTKLTSVIIFLLLGITNPKSNFHDSSNVKNEVTPVSTLLRVCKIKAQFPLPNSNSCAPNSLRLQVGDDCKAELKAELQVINLHDNPVMWHSYPLLQGMSPITIDYGIKNGQRFQTGPITELFYLGNSVYDQNNNIHPVFEYSTNLNIDVSGYCLAGTVNAKIPTEISVLDDNGNIYPVDSYAGPYDAFYCSVFEETCDQCTSCSSGFDPVYNVDICGYCGGCEN